MQVGHRGKCHNFGAFISYNRSEDNTYLNVGEDLEYRDSTSDPIGSDRGLDQKLTQIMVEVARQNKGVRQIKLRAVHDFLPVLIASGFRVELGENKRQRVEAKIREFRQVEGHQLFPPYYDYASDGVYLDMTACTESNVRFSKKWDDATSWDAIIKKNPILESGAAVFPKNL